VSGSEARHEWARGASYERYIGRWSRLVARIFVDRLAIPPGRRWLDAGCGTGALCQAILGTSAPHEVVGIDPSQGYVDYARRHILDARASFEVGDVLGLPVAPETFDAAVSGLVLNFVPEPRRMIAETARVVRPNGIVALYVWDYAGKMELIRYFWDAAASLDPFAHVLDEGVRFPICQPEPLAALFRDAGLHDVVTWAIDIPTDFADFDDYWSPFLAGEGPAPGYAMSLNELDRSALRERIRLALPIESDGSIHLMARAWAVCGLREGEQQDVRFLP
jgi:SAM-dependent methyltransferase